MSEHILDAMITKVYKGPNGKGEHGPWQVYNIYLNKGDDKKFGYMQSGNKSIPTVGMGIKHIEYDVEISGKYTNYKVKKLELVEDEPTSQPEQVPSKYRASTEQPNSNASFYVSYAKDLEIQLMQTDPAHFDGMSFHDIVKEVVFAGLTMMKMVNEGNTPERPKQPPQQQKSDEPIQEPTQEPKEKKTWASKRVFIADVKSYEERLGLDVYADILAEHEINPDELNRLDSKPGGALYDALEEAYKKMKETEE